MRPVHLIITMIRWIRASRLSIHNSLTDLGVVFGLLGACHLGRVKLLLLLFRTRTHLVEREFIIEDLLVRIHFIIKMIRWIGLAPWEFEFFSR